MLKKYIEAGKIVGTHGVRGEMRVQQWCDSAEVFTEFKKFYLDKYGTERLVVKASRPHGNVCLLKADGVDTIEMAETLRGKVLYIDRADMKLADGQFLIDDIVGCRVFDADDNTEYGVISEVSQTGANDVWHIKKDGNEYYLPNVPQFVKSVDIEQRKILITPIGGMFDDEV
ncbi:MAG: 16S rRNA processing protein RimM [Ruminococcaceae bacterium]|nr:16S rRNA processing protein RimM [Oscillospiraceae bacterium]